MMKATANSSFQRLLFLLWHRHSRHTWKYEIQQRSSEDNCTHACAHTNILQESAISRTLSTKSYSLLATLSRKAHTRTEWDGTGHPSFSSNPGAQASRQDADHTFSQMCSKFIPEPTRQIRTRGIQHQTQDTTVSENSTSLQATEDLRMHIFEL